MFASRVTAATKQQFYTQAQRFYTPSIKFTYGDRAKIMAELANSPSPSWFVTWTDANAPKPVVQALERRAGTPWSAGGTTTKVTLMEDGWAGNPFQKKGYRQLIDEQTCAVINGGGVA